MSHECVSDCCLSRTVVHVPWVCEWLLLISNCNSCPVMKYNSRWTAITHTFTVHELQFEINSNHSHTHGTWTTIRDKQQSLTHSWEMNYNSRLTAITHTQWVYEWLLFISNCSSCPVIVCDCCLCRIVVHVPWVCEWLLFISKCSSCSVSVWVIARDMSYISR
jgi:hypothetical protein